MSHVSYVLILSYKRDESCYRDRRLRGETWMRLKHRLGGQGVAFAKPKLNESCHKYQWVKSRMYWSFCTHKMSHFTRINESCHVCMNDSIQTGWVMLQRQTFEVCIGHFARTRWDESGHTHEKTSCHTHMNDSCHARMNVSRETNEYVMPHINKSCHPRSLSFQVSFA